MKSRLIINDIVRNKAISLVTLFFIAITAMLLSLVSTLSVKLFGSIDTLMVQAKAPHFMQMHSGELDIGKLNEFADSNSETEDFQVLSFLNIDSEKIAVNGASLAGTLQDNGFCVQSERFDFLLNLDGKPVYPLQGEVYAPVFYSKDGTIKKGDTIAIENTEFTVAGFVRDSQMNSALAYSKRFIINEQDYAKLQPFGTAEALIEFRLKDINLLSRFEAAYSNAQLPSNGPTLTLPLFRIISAISDGIMIAVIMLVCIIVTLIALLCIRFTLLSKAEEDYKEIGTMKAIGMRLCDIRGIYLSVYGVLALTGCIGGFAMSFLFQRPMQESIRLNFGDSGNSGTAFIIAIISVSLLFCFILFYVRLSLKKFSTISAARAIRFGTDKKPDKSVRLRLSESRLLSANLFLAISDILSRKRLYTTMLAVVMLSAFIIIVPQNLYHTLSSKEFVAYMGIGRCDLRIDLRQSIDDGSIQIEKALTADADVSNFAVLTTKTFAIKQDSGQTKSIKVELGNHSVFPVKCAKGLIPTAENEIALSALCADELEKTIGDTVILLTADGEKELFVCGIYSDITNGGKTAKAVFNHNKTAAAWSVVCIEFLNTADISNKLAQYEKQFSFAKVSVIDDYILQTFGQTLHSVSIACYAAMGAAITVTLLVTLLFLKLLTAKDEYSIAVLKAVGYTNMDLKRQFAFRILSVSAAGILLGTILAGTLGEKIAAAAISSFGAAAFSFKINLTATFLFCPLILLLTVILAVVIGTEKTGKINISASMKE